MGCAPSKRVEAAAIEIYRPPPTSFGVFAINSIEEPWLKAMEAQKQQQEMKRTYVPAPLLEKLNAIEDAPSSWDEVSKALEDLKPALENQPHPHHNPAPPSPHIIPAKVLTPTTPPPPQQQQEDAKAPRKSFSFHTLEELEAKLQQPAKPPATAAENLNKTVLAKAPTPKKVETNAVMTIGPAPQEGYKSVKDNIFIVRDRLEREKDGKPAIKFNPLSDFPEICPPGGENSVVIYTTSLGGVRRTFEDSNKVRTILEWHQFVFDERDVSLHGEFLNELRELLGEGVAVPRMFVKGRYIGGPEEVVNLNETGRLGRIFNWARVERGVGRLGCKGCGGARFVPCLECCGSCKVLVGEEKQRCPSCNENGLVLCPVCD